MKPMTKRCFGLILVCGLLLYSGEVVLGEVCTGFPPQAPRDIDSSMGGNRANFSIAPGYEKLNLCDLHFHVNAEHRAKDFSLFVGEGTKGLGGGYQCIATKSLTQVELKTPSETICGGVNPGDTIEVHWVYSSCDVVPDKTLNSCFSDKCINPSLRVESQVFLMVNDASALNYMDFVYDGYIADGYHQAKSLPEDTGDPVEYVGSTTGPKYDEEICSPFKVTWSVRQNCAKLDINSLGEWCKGNVFGEDHAHGVRKLVTIPALLSEIK